MTRKSGAAGNVRGGDAASVSVLLLDEHRLGRDALQALLATQSSLRVAGAVGERVALLRDATRLGPDVIVVSLFAFTRGLAEALRELAQRAPGAPVLVVAPRATLQLARAAVEAGARGLVSRQCSGAELAKAVRAVAGGRRYIGEDFAAWVGEGAEGRASRKADRLTAAEFEIVRLVTEGKSNHQVAGILGLSPRTVETYRLRLMRKLSVDSLPALVKYAIREGMTGLD